MTNARKSTNWSNNNFSNIMKKSFESIIDLSKPIMISNESVVPFAQAGVTSNDGIIWDLDMMYFDLISRNNNFYPAEDVKRSVNESVWIQENLRNRSLFGELEHPPADSEMSRFMFVEPTRYAACILGLTDKGDHYRGRIGLCAPLGLDIVKKNMDLYGTNYGVSCRISTPNYVVKEMNGRKVFVKKYKMYPITWDVVTCCGIPQCRLIKDGQYQADPKDLSMNRSSESDNLIGATGKVSYDDGSNFIFTDTAKEISKAVASTENAKIIADIYGIDFSKAEKAILTKDNRIKISNESGNIVSVALNSFVLSQALKK